jgi:low affinity Fe/Cu permease
MKKIILSISAMCCVVVLQSCGGAQMDPAAVQAKVDAAAATQIEAANAAATMECETRMTTELKSKADSIVHASQMAQAAQ